MENSESKNYKLMAKIYIAMQENIEEKHINRLLEEYNIDYRLKENPILRLCKPELIDLSLVDFFIEENILNFMFYKTNIWNTLLNSGVNFTIKNDKGFTIIHRLISLFIEYRTDDNWFLDCKFANKLIDAVLDAHIKTNNSTNPNDNNGMSHFHIACMANHAKAVEFFLNNKINPNQIVHLDSPYFPGYTALHFAARYCSFEVACLLVKSGANLYVKDAIGILPIQITMRLSIDSTYYFDVWYYTTRISIVEKIIELFLDKENEDSANFTSSLGFSNLHTAACIASNSSTLEYYLKGNYFDANAAIHVDSLMWPGYTPLHFASHFKTNAFKILFENGGDIKIKDANGKTPLEIIVTRCNVEYLHAILMIHPIWKNIILSDGKTKLLDLIWAMRELDELNDFLSKTNVNVNNLVIPFDSTLWPGYTPLHLAILFSEIFEMEPIEDYWEPPRQVVVYLERINLILRHGADKNPKNLDELTPWDLEKRLNRKNFVSYSTDAYSKIWEATVASYEHTNTPYEYADFSNLLLTLVQRNDDERRIFIDALMTNIDRQRQIEEDYGLTMLHFACWQLDINWVKDLLIRIDVNARTNFNLPCWAGYTPLHLLMWKSARYSDNRDSVDVIMQLLLNNGADIMLTNAKQSTSIHKTAGLKDFMMYVYSTDNPESYANSLYTGILLRRLKDFNVNPINDQGISHFHIACIRNEVQIIEQFLNCGVDVNEPVNLFSDTFAGCTPLHLAMVPGPFVDNSSRRRTIDLLIESGADIFVEDSRGNTLLHAAAKSHQPRDDLLEKFIGLGLDVHAMNTVGDTPLESLLISKNFTLQELKVFINHGCRIESINPINHKGYLNTIFSAWDETENSIDDGRKILNALTEIVELKRLDDLGRTVIHNFVSNDHGCENQICLVDYIIDQGSIDIDHRDNLGKTALHVAAEFQHNVKELLIAGADINIIDNSGESAFSYTLKLYDKLINYFEDYDKNGVQSREWYDNEHLPGQIRIFTEHVKMMQYCGLHVSEHIADMLLKAGKVDFSGYDRLNAMDGDNEKRISVYKQIERTKGIKFGWIMLYNFLSEFRAMKVCRMASSTELAEIDDFFLTTDNQIHKEIDKVFYIAKRIYKKTLARVSLIDTATTTFSQLLGFPLPYLCSEPILGYLSNKDLENLIIASSIRD